MGNEDASAWEQMCMPALQANNWRGMDECLYRKLLEKSDEMDAQLPVLSVGLDKPDFFQAFPSTENNRANADYFFELALKNLAEIEVDITEIEGTGFPFFVVHDNYFASEKLVDVQFMKAIAERLNTPLIAAASPRRGTMMFTNGILAPEVMTQFVGIVELKHGENEDTVPISSTVFLSDENGKLIGIVRPTSD